ncbi:hypothetical protein PoB_003644100 [Plakobranchus ocellatus]|uniref:Uncharacterized protein n=1 Tax=Plakobranchus ocellatus TaxID=259542 RepID=A0AAV4AP44_9GAST|nr:hypothetical protein PoB_003644100 [Plakobranchus ocellatus]
MLEDPEDTALRSIQPQIRTGRKWKIDEAVHQAKEGLPENERGNWSHSKWKERTGIRGSKVVVKHRRQRAKRYHKLMRPDSKRIQREHRKQFSNLSKDIGQAGKVKCRELSHGMRSGTWRHLESASSYELFLTFCLQMQIWCGGE